MANGRHADVPEGEEREGRRGGRGMLLVVVLGAAVVVLLGIFAAMYVSRVRQDVGNLQTEILGPNGSGGGLKARVADTERQVAKVEKDLADMRKHVNAQLNFLEDRINGHARRAGVRAGIHEDKMGIDHQEFLVHIKGFATGKSELTAGMKKFIDDGGYDTSGQWVPGVPEATAKGWKPGFVACFADIQPFLVDGKDMNPQLSDDRGSNTATYIAERWATKFKHSGRGSTTKFGDNDVNRGCLMYYTK